MDDFHAIDLNSGCSRDNSPARSEDGDWVILKNPAHAKAKPQTPTQPDTQTLPQLLYPPAGENVLIPYRLKSQLEETPSKDDKPKAAEQEERGRAKTRTNEKETSEEAPAAKSIKTSGRFISAMTKFLSALDQEGRGRWMPKLMVGRDYNPLTNPEEYFRSCSPARIYEPSSVPDARTTLSRAEEKPKPAPTPTVKITKAETKEAEKPEAEKAKTKTAQPKCFQPPRDTTTMTGEDPKAKSAQKKNENAALKDFERFQESWADYRTHWAKSRGEGSSSSAGPVETEETSITPGSKRRITDSVSSARLQWQREMYEAERIRKKPSANIHCSSKAAQPSDPIVMPSFASHNMYINRPFQDGPASQHSVKKTESANGRVETQSRHAAKDILKHFAERKNTD